MSTLLAICLHGFDKFLTRSYDHRKLETLESLYVVSQLSTALIVSMEIPNLINSIAKCMHVLSLQNVLIYKL